MGRELGPRQNRTEAIARRNNWRTSVFAVVVAVGVLSLGWAIVRPPSVPLYDGIGYPDDPYRYVQPPPGHHHTPSPSEGRATSAAANGTNTSGFYVNTVENAPQLSLFVPPHSLSLPSTANMVAVRAAPEAPDVQPRGTTIDGNVYLIVGGVVADGHTTESDVSLATSAAGPDSLRMRATTARTPAPSFVYRPDRQAPWRQLKTDRAGRDIYATDFAGFGEYALAFASTTGHRGSPWGVLWPVIGTGGLIIGIVLTIRRGRRGTATDRS